MCTLTRDAKPLAVVNPTPGSIPIDKGKGTISVLCKLPSYLDASGAMESEFQAMTFGNILFGGLIGVVVDAASGAMHQYPTMITIVLIPERFATPEERDAFFEKMKTSLLAEAAEVKDRIGKMCREDQCQGQLDAADAGTKAKLAEIEQKRALAQVGG